jgi:hypothetical protein
MDDHPGTPFPHYGEQQGAKRRLGRFKRALLWFTFLLYAIPISGWVVLDHVADRRLQKTIRKLREAGYAVDLKEMVPGPVPSLDNGAPLYEAAFAQIRDAKKEIDQIGYGTWDLYTPEEHHQAMEVFDRYEEAFVLARRARQKPYCRFERDYARGPEERKPEYEPLGTLSLGLSVRAEALALEGRHDEARETVQDLWSLAFAFRSEPLVWSQTCLQSLFGRAVDATVRCSRVSRSETDWRLWQELLPDPSLVGGSLFLELRSQLAFSAKDALEGHPYGREFLFFQGRWEDRLLGRLARPFLALASAEGLRRYQKQIARLERSEVARHEELLLQDSPPRRGILKFSLVDITSCPARIALQRTVVLQSSVAVARAGMECERAWLAEGRYPESLSERDPMTGRPLEYSLDGMSLFSKPLEGRYGYYFKPEDEGLVWNLLHAAD